MNKAKSQATISYMYSLGNVNIKSVTTSNVVATEIREVNLIAKKYCNSDVYRPLDVLTYTIVITNNGSYPARNIKINDQIAHQNFVDDSLNVTTLENATVSFNTHIEKDSIIIEIEKIEPNEVLVINYKARVVEELARDICLCNTSTISSTETKPISTNKISLEQKFANVICEKRALSDFTFLNTDMTYEITLKNNGTLDAYDLEVIDQLPATFELSPENQAVTLDGEEVSIYSFDPSSAILKVLVPKLEASSSTRIVVNGRIVR